MNIKKIMASILVALLTLGMLSAAQAMGECPNGQHKWTQWDILDNFGCAVPGFGVRYCTVCGKQESGATPAPGHSWGGWIQDTAPTCTQSGSQHRNCSRCGATDYGEIKSVPHQYTKWTAIKEPTCTEYGIQEAKCMTCQQKFTRQIEKTDHSWGEWYLIKPSTSNSVGIRERQCNVCGQTEQETFYPEGTLMRDNKNNDKETVKKLQEALAKEGFKSGRINGSYGREVEKAVKRYQEKAGLRADGIAWPETQDRIWQRTPVSESKIGLNTTVTGGQKSMYKEGDRVKISLSIFNTGTKDLVNPRIEFFLGEVMIVKGTVLKGDSDRPFKAGDAIFDIFEYTIPSAYEGLNFADLHFIGYAYDGETEVQSEKHTISLQFEQAVYYDRPQVHMELDINGKNKDYYEEGDQVIIDLRLTNTGNTYLKNPHIDYFIDNSYPSANSGLVLEETRRMRPGGELQGKYTYTITRADAENGMATFGFAGWMDEDISGIPQRYSDVEYVTFRVRKPNQYLESTQVSLMAAIVEGKKESYVEGDKIAFELILQNTGEIPIIYPRLEYFYGAEYSGGGILIEEMPGDREIGTMRSSYTYTVTHADAENGLTTLGFIASVRDVQDTMTIHSNPVLFSLPVQKEAPERFSYPHIIIDSYIVKGKKDFYFAGDTVEMEVVFHNAGTIDLRSPRIEYYVGASKESGNSELILEDPEFHFLQGMKMRGHFNYTITEEDAKKGAVMLGFTGRASDWDNSYSMSLRTYEITTTEILPVHKKVLRRPVNPDPNLVLVADYRGYEVKDAYSEGDILTFRLELKNTGGGKLRDYKLMYFKSGLKRPETVALSSATDGNALLHYANYFYTVTEADVKNGKITLNFAARASNEKGEWIDSNPVVFNIPTIKAYSNLWDNVQLELGVTQVEGNKPSYHGVPTAFKVGDKLTYQVTLKNIGPLYRVWNPQITCTHGTTSSGPEEVIVAESESAMEVFTSMHKRYTYTVTQEDMERGFAAFTFVGSAETDAGRIYSDVASVQLIIQQEGVAEGERKAQIALSGGISRGRKAAYTDGDEIVFELDLRNVGDVELQGTVLEGHVGKRTIKFFEDKDRYFETGVSMGAYQSFKIKRADIKGDSIVITLNAYAYDENRNRADSNILTFTLPITKP